ncbi:hypothetical protein QTQ03_29230 [Micromonospora sp. WMMA1363]|uniref:hypothetical protein n=1 Tax=Micromonospora sp. WMMA1363 TaxID=3053985 RepID=UPI00259C8171|nr:hypothetical protein [Micromonospora sp. WMMA1363]MDM4723467.1 hypothetical protein [Micromonospora sp. WMMA1363]
MTPDQGPSPVTLILDRSALVAYAVNRSIHVGEPLHEVIEDGNLFGVTAVTVAEAETLVTDRKDWQVLRQLLGRDACLVLPTRGDTWRELAYWRAVTGRGDLATTVLAALEHRASILSADANRYGPEGHLPVIYIPQ